MAELIIVFREVFEAALIIGILYIAKLQQELAAYGFDFTRLSGASVVESTSAGLIG